MVKRIRILALLAVFVVVVSTLVACYTAVRPDRGSRIVVLDNVSLDILDRFGLADNIAGVPSSGYEHISDRYLDKDRYKDVGVPMWPNYAEIAHINPSEVVISDATQKSFGNIKSDFDAINVAVEFENFNGINELKSSIMSMGEYFDRANYASDIISQIETREGEIIDSFAELQYTPRVLTLFGAPLGTAEQSISIATSGLYAGNLVDYIGATNVADELYPDGSPAIFKPDNWANIVRLDPDYILATVHGDSEAVFDMYDTVWDKAPYNSLRAVRQNKVYYISDDIIGVIATLSYTQSMQYIVDIFAGKVDPYRGGYIA